MNTENYFELAELAEASYANLWDSDTSQTITNNADVILALTAKGFSESQATKFTTNWEVVAGGHQPNTESGYSSTLFKNTDGSYVLAFRGTEGLLSDDFLTPVIPEHPLAGHLFTVFSENQRIN